MYNEYEKVLKIINEKEKYQNRYFEKLKWLIVENKNGQCKNYNINLPAYDIQKSFYNKAYININTDIYNYYVITLYSCNTPILMIDNGIFKRLYDNWTKITGRHIKAFCGFNKKEFFEIPYYEEV